MILDQYESFVSHNSLGAAFILGLAVLFLFLVR